MASLPTADEAHISDLVASLILADGAASRLPSPSPSRSQRQSRRLLEAAGCATPIDDFELAGETRLQKLRACLRSFTKRVSERRAYRPYHRRHCLQQLQTLSGRLPGWSKWPFWPLDMAAAEPISSVGPASVLLAVCKRPTASVEQLTSSGVQSPSPFTQRKPLNVRKLRSWLERSGELNESLAVGAADVALHHLTRFANATMPLEDAQNVVREILSDAGCIRPQIDAADSLRFDIVDADCYCWRGDSSHPSHRCFCCATGDKRASLGVRPGKKCETKIAIAMLPTFRLETPPTRCRLVSSICSFNAACRLQFVMRAR